MGFLSDAWDSIKGGVSKVWDWTGGTVIDKMKDVGDWVGEGWNWAVDNIESYTGNNSVGDYASSAYSLLKDAYGGINDFLKTGLGNVVSGALGTLGTNYLNQANAKEAFTQSKEGAELAFQRTKEMYNQRYQSTAADMKAAGLNPILAASGGFNIGGSPSMQAPQSYMAAPVTPLGASAVSFGELSKVPYEISKMQQDVMESVTRAERNMQDVVESFQRIENMRTQQGLMSSQEKVNVEKVKEIQANIVKMGSEVQKMRQEIIESASKTQLNYDEAMRVRWIQSEIKANIIKINEEAVQLRSLNAELIRTAEVYKGPLGSVLKNVNEIRKSLGISTVIVPSIPSRGGKAATSGWRP